MLKPAADHFSGHSQAYQQYRPHYPDWLFAQFARWAPGDDLALDLGSGGGQAALGLMPHFRQVLAGDLSLAQLATAPAGLARVACRSEALPIANGQVDLITVAQALHWFDLPPFYREVQRVLKPGGVLAVWCYELAQVDPAIDAQVAHFYRQVVGPFWPPERRHVEQGYRDLPFPFAPLAHDPIRFTVRWPLARFLGYLGTWSATQGYLRHHRQDPIVPLRRTLAPLWGEGEREVHWPLSLRAGRRID
ncbi:class I SAM-dependent methyltransferase [Ferrimonas balearica]|uniref:class I SAM-dependent methyltransferase n=1 Tax=Ferrimonas balearica TaxID=44012 RepID=UPI001C991D81|nr:class I SAM-dependent methyltransferase [Ferrimonas balearica]MBY5993547.1 class I SAM-dependent methyltransferase [Ferrimonas balearica]